MADAASSASRMTPDTAGAGNEASANATTVGRSSEVNSTRPANEDITRLTHQLFKIYETRDMAEQRSLIESLYSEDARFDDNATSVKGREAVVNVFALLPKLCDRISVEYQPPVVLGATSSAPAVLQNYGDKGRFQVEIQSKQVYTFGRDSAWRKMLLPDEVTMPVLTTLDIDRQTHKITAHKDQWQGKKEHSDALRKCAGLLGKAAGSTVAAKA